MPLLPPYPAAIPNAYSLEIQLYRGFCQFRVQNARINANEQRLAQKRGVPTEAPDDLINSVPAGSLGLMTQPYWAPGLKLLRGQKPRARLSVLRHPHAGRSHRSMIEGIGYALSEGAERTSKRSRLPIEAIRIAGGGSQSPAAMQIAADIFGCCASRPHV